MWDAINRGLALALISAPLLIGCGGGNAGNPGAVNTAQCSGSSCPAEGPPSSGTVASLCPATADIGNTTYLGGAGSGEVISLNINATAMTYTLTWLESPIPLATGTVTPTRAGVQITGAVVHPPAGTLPTAEQTRCAFVLTPGSYSTAADFNSANPPTIFVGNGVAGGGIPGATVQFSGLTIVVYQNVGQVPNRHFDFYPFLGFASTTTDITKLPGTYNSLLYHLTPSGNYATVGTNSIETFDASGTCTSTNTPNPNYSPNAGGCLTTGNPYTLDSNGYFDSTQAPQIVAQTSLPLVGQTGKSGVAHMILGQLNGATVPLVVRTGNVNLGTGALHSGAQVDDESGIALLTQATPLASGGFDGGYVGADSNFNYTATLINGATGTFVNPETSSAEEGFGLTYGLATPGLVGVTATNPSTGAVSTGYAIAGGGLYAILVQGQVYNGVVSTSANSTTSNSPYFGVGAQVNK
jgi:hypothetical protein